MSYTQKQRVFAVYMLMQIGITDTVFINKYLYYLAYLYGKKNSVSACIQNLIDEIKIKKTKHQIKIKIEPPKYLSATRISDYTYCPASYSINNTFFIEKPNGVEFTELGKLLHEKLLLVRKIQERKASNYYDRVFDDDPVLQKILDSKLIFCGHDNNTNTFTNSEENFKGTPDYIFLDSENNYFVVEEKFHKKRDPFKPSYEEVVYCFEDQDRISDAYKWLSEKAIFYINHQLQLFSYMRNIQEYDIKYGYLIYWYYDLSHNGPYIHKAAIKQIQINSEVEKLYQSEKRNLQILVNTKTQDFDVKALNPNKCAGCVVSLYCSHKTGRYVKLKFPYDINDIRIFSVPFPEELKKDNNNLSTSLPPIEDSDL